MSKQETQPLTVAKLSEYLDLFGFKNIPDTEKRQFIEICQMSALNPFKREAYISAYGEGKYRQFAIITSYEVYIKRAEESGLLLHWSSPVIEACKTAKPDLKGNISFIDDIQATVTIERKGFSNPFTHTVKFSEYVQKTKDGNVNKFWQKAETMLKKVAIAQGFRLCFPEILNGLPYAREEMNNDNNTNDQKTTTTPLVVNTPEKVIKTKALPELQPDSKEWDKAIDYLVDGNDTEKEIKKIKEKYSLSPENEKELVIQATEIQISKEDEK
ncbi:MAG: hypothetical protein GF317_23330 [Candidatus Lokiarchaeota archaeon]|nr:hypothetical protein [Candidatus Lokiarchaeota archaeon]